MNHPPASTSTCTNCGSNNRWFYHHVNLRGIERRLCTSCVLRLHPSSFCPSCFEFFEHPLSSTSSSSAHRFLSCVKCSSLTHLHCLPSPTHSSFLCPPCSVGPSFSFFRIDHSAPVLDHSLSLVLLCASKIASSSISRALTLATAKADRTVREAALARKRVRDSLDHVSALHRAKRAALQPSIEVSASRNLGIHKVITNPVNGLSDNENKNGFIGNNGTAATDVKLEPVQTTHGR